MRKILAIVLAAVMVLALCACDSYTHRSIEDDAAAYFGSAAAAPKPAKTEDKAPAAPAAPAAPQAEDTPAPAAADAETDTEAEAPAPGEPSGEPSGAPTGEPPAPPAN